MGWVLTAVLTGVVFFAATNIDGIFVLILFFSQVDEELRNWHVVVGQYLGFATLVALSLLGSFGALIVAEEWIGLLGLVPIFLGVRAFVRLWSDSEEESKPVSSSGVWGVAVMTLADGGDNIGTYVPLFAGAGSAQIGIIVVVFFALVAVWCYLGYKLGSHPTIADKVDRYGHIIVPFVLVGLGTYILLESGSPYLLV